MKKFFIVSIVVLILVAAFSVARITGFLNKTLISQTCEDTDYKYFFKERSFYEQGETLIMDSLSHVIANYTDYCLDNEVIVEYSCKWSYKDGTFTAKRFFYECPNGCNDGKCN